MPHIAEARAAQNIGHVDRRRLDRAEHRGRISLIFSFPVNVALATSVSHPQFVQLRMDDHVVQYDIAIGHHFTNDRTADVGLPGLQARWITVRPLWYHDLFKIVVGDDSVFVSDEEAGTPSQFAQHRVDGDES
ncbi:hypothetical protein ACM01_40910 [Streptomyces viridochromogenes]|uniref:Uncharacterized protein n=1 Tax=Streptomyces viridochromogenes TaxID=1938 RepID=A0A0J8BQW8_STRVR|nr:hypothetical protein ACM01_40910 [Streptomyces viridochromogenes]KOG10500.1 hypothetical protein ADK35_37770 [Streptomyces viridochromogenes]KOG18604.1 hypothetical protein ADK36_21595 [Streptomyces viridochromogenes]